MSQGELGRRVTVALIGIPIAVVVIYMGGWALGLLMALAGALGTAEYYSLARAKGVDPFNWIGVPAAALFPILATIYPSYSDFSEHALTLGVVVLLLSMAGVLWLRWPEGSPMAVAASTVTGALYGGATLSFWVLLRHLPDTVSGAEDPMPGVALVLFAVAVTWMGDTFAYFFGTRFGKRKLLESVSPKKTRLGAGAGLIGSTLTAGGLGYFLLANIPGHGISWPVAMLFGIVIGVMGQIGDLAESVMKRDSSMKDSGAILPGHGGVLDRLDALYFTVPVAFLMFLWVARLG